MRGYTTAEVAKLLGLSAGQVRSYVRSGFLDPALGARGELRFSFQDLVLLRTAKGLVEARIAPRRVRRALRNLTRQLPAERPPTGVSISAEGDRIVVRDGASRWNPESGQTLFNFEVDELARRVAPIAHRLARAAKASGERWSADEWYDLGCDVEAGDAAEARDAYRRAVELDPHHADAHVNLGRLLHESRELAAAEAHYRLALAVRAEHETAAYNLGVVLEDLGRTADAVAAYERALKARPDLAEAHFNVARLYERTGKPGAALRHFSAYRRLTGGNRRR